LYGVDIKDTNEDIRVIEVNDNPSLESGEDKYSDKINANGLFGFGGKPLKEKSSNEGSAARFFYCAKPSPKERNCGLEDKNTHVTVKPIKLMEWLVTLVTTQESIVLDPFMGSGTTGIACKNLRRTFVGIEMVDEYFEIAKARIENYK
jgi:site-specific DNA-methyltransferase (adenine-specific)